MAAGGKKDAGYLAGVMEEEIFKFDPERIHTDVLYFDGAANVQKCGLRLCGLYPRAYLFHGRELVISLFFSDITKIAFIKVPICDFIFFVSFSTILLYCLTLNLLKIIIIKVCRMYNVFGSGAEHGIYAQLIQNSGVHNNGKRIGLLRGAGTRFLTYFYAMMHLVCLQATLLATIYQSIFSDINFNDHVRSSVMDIKNKTFWKDLYTLLIYLYPVIRALRYCDSNVSAMEKISWRGYACKQTACLTHARPIAYIFFVTGNIGGRGRRRKGQSGRTQDPEGRGGGSGGSRGRNRDNEGETRSGRGRQGGRQRQGKRQRNG